MRNVQSYLALLCVALVISPGTFAQQAPAAASAQNPSVAVPQRAPGIAVPGLTGPAQDPQIPGMSPPSVPTGRSAYFTNYINRYRNPVFAPVNLANSPRLDQLLRSGKLYLSLQDAIALALENSLDVEVARYGPGIAQSNVLRAEAGGLLRGLSQNVSNGPTSAVNLSTGNAGGAAGGSQNLAQASNGGTSSGTIITSTGVAIPQFDPLFFAQYGIGHSTNIQSNSFTTGISSVVVQSNRYNVGFQQAWAPGTTLTANFNNLTVNSNAPRNEINPLINSSVNIQLSQRLLQGFGSAINTRNIRIARNSLKVQDLVFQEQVIQTVYAVINLYSDLVSFNEDVRVKKQALAYAEKLYNDNRKQVEIGTLAPIEIVRAEAEVANNQQQLTASETSLLQQETIIKNYLSKNGIASPSLADARIVPTDNLQLPPAQEKILPVQDYVQMALDRRPELRQTDMNIVNSKLSLEGSKSQLRPSLDLQLSATNNGLAGTPNGLPAVLPDSSTAVLPATRIANPALVGGYGSVLGQLFRRNYPDYSVGFQLNVPLRNRAAQADVINDTLSLRQQELQRVKNINQIRVDVQNAVIGLQQARARYEAAVKTRILGEQTLDAEQKKYALGSSTVFQVVQAQRDLANYQGAEVSAISQYNRARNQLEYATGQVLEVNRVDIDEAKVGRVSRPPNALPEVGQK